MLQDIKTQVEKWGYEPEPGQDPYKLSDRSYNEADLYVAPIVIRGDARDDGEVYVAVYSNGEMQQAVMNDDDKYLLWDEIVKEWGYLKEWNDILNNERLTSAQCKINVFIRDYYTRYPDLMNFVNRPSTAIMA